MTTKTKYYIDACGEKVPAKHVSTYNKKRDQIARQIAKEWLVMESRIKTVKENTFDRIEKLRKAAAESAGIKDLGGEKGNIQFRSFDGAITVILDNSRKTEFDERLSIAQGLIMEAVREMSDGEHNADLIEIATKAFQPRRNGNLDMQRIRDLRTYNVKHPKWQKAIKIISDCERVIGHCQYLRVSIRENGQSSPRNINLDIAKV